MAGLMAAGTDLRRCCTSALCRLFPVRSIVSGRGAELVLTPTATMRLDRYQVGLAGPGPRGLGCRLVLDARGQPAHIIGTRGYTGCQQSARTRHLRTVSQSAAPKSKGEVRPQSRRSTDPQHRCGLTRVNMQPHSERHFARWSNELHVHIAAVSHLAQLGQELVSGHVVVAAGRMSGP